MTARISLAALTMFVPTIAAADDGYCDYVEGTAAATAAPLYAPDVYGVFGYIEQPTFTTVPPDGGSDLRVLGGVRYSVTNIFAGNALRSRARADCSRHEAIMALRGATTARALAARIRVYEEAQPEADRALQQVTADVEARRATTPEATAIRLRVEELRTLASRARSELAALPSPDQRPLAALLTAYRSADGDIEASEGSLRKISAYDVTVRAGVQRYLEGPNAATDFFAVLQVGVNVGALWIGRHNDRAARGRSRYARSGYDALGATQMTEQVRSTIDVTTKRATAVSALVAELGQQLDMLAKLGGDENKRFRRTIWFDWIEAKAELAYLEAYLAALRDVAAATK